ncbi:MAG: hypothetical protein AMJ75_09310 [Phycisphaerae bacterium SM1_79]|nr:MAG: hypothetical protein AMJ75_09310 [Phycisphaerae bacterium SM1_79]
MAQSEKYGWLDIPGIPTDEPVFIVRAQDCFAAFILDIYDKMLASTGNTCKADEIHKIKLDFLNWPTKKIPD